MVHFKSPKTNRVKRLSRANILCFLKVEVAVSLESMGAALITTSSAYYFQEKFYMNKTDANLKSAFAGESQANRRYLAFARKAEEEGFTQAAKLFRAAAEAETIHALNHLQVTGEVKSTLDNLSAALGGETYEFQKMYPEFLADAKEEGNKGAAWSFDVANKVEQVHAKLCQKAIDVVKAKKEMAKVDYYVCGNCGNTIEGEPPEICSICGAPRSKFFKPA